MTAARQSSQQGAPLLVFTQSGGWNFIDPGAFFWNPKKKNITAVAYQVVLCKRTQERNIFLRNKRTQMRFVVGTNGMNESLLGNARKEKTKRAEVKAVNSSERIGSNVGSLRGNPGHPLVGRAIRGRG